MHGSLDLLDLNQVIQFAENALRYTTEEFRSDKEVIVRNFECAERLNRELVRTENSTRSSTSANVFDVFHAEECEYSMGSRVGVFRGDANFSVLEPRPAVVWMTKVVRAVWSECGLPNSAVNEWTVMDLIKWARLACRPLSSCEEVLDCSLAPRILHTIVSQQYSNRFYHPLPLFDELLRECKDENYSRREAERRFHSWNANHPHYDFMHQSSDRRPPSISLSHTPTPAPTPAPTTISTADSFRGPTAAERGFQHPARTMGSPIRGRDNHNRSQNNNKHARSPGRGMRSRQLDNHLPEEASLECTPSTFARHEQRQPQQQQQLQQAQRQESCAEEPGSELHSDVSASFPPRCTVPISTGEETLSMKLLRTLSLRLMPVYDLPDTPHKEELLHCIAHINALQQQASQFEHRHTLELPLDKRPQYQRLMQQFATRAADVLLFAEAVIAAHALDSPSSSTLTSTLTSTNAPFPFANSIPPAPNPSKPTHAKPASAHAASPHPPYATQPSTPSSSTATRRFNDTNRSNQYQFDTAIQFDPTSADYHRSASPLFMDLPTDVITGMREDRSVDASTSSDTSVLVAQQTPKRSLDIDIDSGCCISSSSFGTSDPLDMPSQQLNESHSAVSLFESATSCPAAEVIRSEEVLYLPTSPSEERVFEARNCDYVRYDRAQGTLMEEDEEYYDWPEESEEYTGEYSTDEDEAYEVDFCSEDDTRYEKLEDFEDVTVDEDSGTECSAERSQRDGSPFPSAGKTGDSTQVLMATVGEEAKSTPAPTRQVYRNARLPLTADRPSSVPIPSPSNVGVERSRCEPSSMTEEDEEDDDDDFRSAKHLPTQSARRKQHSHHPPFGSRRRLTDEDGQILIGDRSEGNNNRDEFGGELSSSIFEDSCDSRDMSTDSSSSHTPSKSSRASSASASTKSTCVTIDIRTHWRVGQFSYNPQ